MKSLPSAVLLCVLALLPCTPTLAAIFSSNDPSITPTLPENFVTGTGNVTIDTATGLAWLDLTLSTDLSFNFVTAQLGPGGSFAGYRYASAVEVETFWKDAGIKFPNLGEFEDSIAMSSLQSVWGSVPFQGHFLSQVITSESFSPNSHQPSLISNQAGLDLAFHTGVSISDITSSPSEGAALVRDAEGLAPDPDVLTPEPTTLIIWSVGLLAGFGLKRFGRRKGCRQQRGAP